MIAPDHRLLLRAVLLDGEEARDAWREWRALVDVDLVDEPSQRLLPLLARRLPEIAPDDPVRNLVKGMYRYAWVRNHLLWRAARPVLDTLDRSQIPTVLLKGIALVHAYGDDWGARPMYDVDVLVPGPRAGDAIDVLAGLGWQAEQGQTAAWVRWRAVSRRHAWGFTHGDGHLDLHWHVLADATGARADERFWADARRVEIDGTTARVLDPAHLLLHVIAHGPRTAGAPAIQWVADAVTVLRTAGDGDPHLLDRFADEARAQGLLSEMRLALATIGEVLTPATVASPLAALDRRNPHVLGRFVGAPVGGEPLRQLRRRAAGGTGLLRGGAEVVRDRLDLGLTTRPAAATAYALTRRSHAVARLARRRGGSFVRTPATDAPRLAPGDALDFTDPVVLDRYGSVGWGRSEPGGATSRGSEPRLVLPLSAPSAGGDLVLDLTIEAREDEQPITVVANETPVARLVATPRPATTRIRVPSTLVSRFEPFELAFRTRGRRAGGSVRIRLRSVELPST